MNIIFMLILIILGCLLDQWSNRTSSGGGHWSFSRPDHLLPSSTVQTIQEADVQVMEGEDSSQVCWEQDCTLLPPHLLGRCTRGYQHLAPGPLWSWPMFSSVTEHQQGLSWECLPHHQYPRCPSLYRSVVSFTGHVRYQRQSRWNCSQHWMFPVQVVLSPVQFTWQPPVPCEDHPTLSSSNRRHWCRQNIEAGHSSNSGGRSAENQTTSGYEPFEACHGSLS